MTSQPDAPPALPSLRTEAIFRAAQERIKEYILQNHLGPGDPLPAEFVLARGLGISRNSLREAMKALEIVGVIETRHGLGTFVGRASFAPLIAGVAFNLRQGLDRDTRTFGELLELREILEAELVRRVAGRHTPADLARLEGAVRRMEEGAGRGAFDREADRDFHDALYAPLDNHLMSLLLLTFWDVQHAVEAGLPPTDYRATTNARWHRDILDAVRAGDAAAAVAAMREQFTGVRARLAALDGDEDGDAAGGGSGV
ncbi:MAG TPA: FCD domain-containing protein [Thermomicrobiales bacterium]|nr:FCD domain-containing protein [Thermomicrobiales bacterium]